MPSGSLERHAKKYRLPKSINKSRKWWNQHIKSRNSDVFFPELKTLPFDQLHLRLRSLQFNNDSNTHRNAWMALCRGSDIHRASKAQDCLKASNTAPSVLIDAGEEPTLHFLPSLSGVTLVHHTKSLQNAGSVFNGQHAK